MSKKIFSSAFRSSEETRDEFQALNKGADFKVMAILVTVALCLSLIKYFGDFRFLLDIFLQLGFNTFALRFENYMTIDPDAQLHRLIYWASNVIIFYCIPPFILIKWVFREKLSAYGLSLSTALKDYKVYLLMLCIMIPLVLFFSGTESFQSRYPFYEVRPGQPFYPNLFLWELVYFIQFFALEFFFRGFMVHGTKQRFGFYSVFVMTIPYCMIHFGKPFPETIAAIIAGIVLGTLSLKSRSIWLGVGIHYSVAITMDLCSLWQKGLL